MRTKIFASIGFFCIASAAAACPQNGFVLGVEPYAPFQIEKDGAWRGVDVDIMRAVADKMGCGLEVRSVPWKRHLAEMQETGAINVAASASNNPERRSWALFSDTYRPSENILITAKTDTAQYANLGAFFDSGAFLAVVRGYDYGAAAPVISAQPNIEEVASPERALRMVAAGRVGGTIGDRLVMGAIAKEEGVSDKLALTDTVTDRDDVYFMFAKATVSDAEVAAFNASLQALEDSGALSEILSRYID